MINMQKRINASNIFIDYASILNNYFMVQEQQSSKSFYIGPASGQGHLGIAQGPKQKINFKYYKLIISVFKYKKKTKTKKKKGKEEEEEEEGEFLLVVKITHFQS